MFAWEGEEKAQWQLRHPVQVDCGWVQPCQGGLEQGSKLDLIFCADAGRVRFAARAQGVGQAGCLGEWQPWGA